MLHDLLLAVLIVLVSFLYFKFVKLTREINYLYEYFENSLDEINKKLEETLFDITNSTSKIQDRICGVHQSIENCHKEMVDLTKKSFEGQVEHTKLIEKFNTSNTKNIVSTAMKDVAAYRQDIYNAVTTLKDKLDIHDNNTINCNKEVGQLLAELLSAIQSLSVVNTDNLSTDTPDKVEKPKKAIRRNRRKYTKDTEEVK